MQSLIKKLNELYTKCKEAPIATLLFTKQFVEQYPQYSIEEAYIHWEDGQYIKEDGYSPTDLKLYWYYRGRRVISTDELSNLFYVEGLLLLYHKRLSYDSYAIACLKIFISRADDTRQWDMHTIFTIMNDKYASIVMNSQEIMKKDRVWRPEVKKRISKVKRVMRNISREEFCSIIAESPKKTYKACLSYFIEKTSLSSTIFKRYLKEYEVVFEEKEPTGGFYPRTKKANKTYWLNEIHGEEWKLPIEEISKLLVKRDKTLRKDIDNPYSECVLTKTAIKNWKYKKMKELGLKKTEHKKTEEKKRTIPDMRMEFSNHQAAETAPTAAPATVIAEEKPAVVAEKKPSKKKLDMDFSIHQIDGNLPLVSPRSSKIIEDIPEGFFSRHSILDDGF